MKLNRFKILMFLIIIVLLIMLIPIIKNKIMYYKVKDKFLATIYELDRNGNFHIIQKTKIKNSMTADIEQTVESYGKDGISYYINSSLTKMNGKEYNSVSYVYYGLKDTVHMSESDGEFHGGIIPSDVMSVAKPVANVGARMFEDCRFNKIEKGTYNGKDCYIIEVDWEEYSEKLTVYVDPETYIPYGMKHDTDGQIEDTEYLIIEIGTVEELPIKINIEELKENATPQVVSV